ncbi:hypothetical protein AGR4B_Cc70178 [Agrobacterium tumefaciens str. CFBP 5621]|nr:hypothetical protein AGR4B_Cc70178 [Agrobacterium tumefaciens str. CFBP 5621]
MQLWPWQPPSFLGTRPSENGYRFCSDSRKNDSHRFVPKISDRFEARISRSGQAFLDDGVLPVEAINIREVEAVLLDIGEPLGLVPYDFHELM